MGKMKEHPRYNVVSVRISDAELAELDAMRGSVPRSQLLLLALDEKLIRERQMAYDEYLRARGV